MKLSYNLSSVPGGLRAHNIKVDEVEHANRDYTNGESPSDIHNDLVSSLSVVPDPFSDSLSYAKVLAFGKVDIKTQELISRGFEYPVSSGKYFSLSLPGQAKLLGLDAIRSEPGFEYPVEFNTVDDTGKHVLNNASEVRSMFKAAVAVYRAHVDGGTALKDQIRAATTVEEVAAVEDTR